MQVTARKIAPSPEVLKRLQRSRIEASTLEEKDLYCPICNFRIQTVYSDIKGHLRVKCPKCKEIHILNLAYFRRMKQLKRVAGYQRAFARYNYKNEK